MEQEKRIKELYERSEARSIYTYTDFINETRQAEIKSAYKHVTFWGGADFAERKIARFGDEKSIAYGEEFPIKVLKISLLGGKFASTITHRDVLGAIMACGIERDKVGDIFVDDCAYVVISDTVCEHLARELTSVGRNNVKVEIAENIDESFAPKTEEKSIPAQSNRLDAIICKLFNLSRENAVELVEQGRVFIDGAPCEKGSKPLKVNETVSVRGFGKFKYIGENGKSKKGKTYFIVSLYI